MRDDANLITANIHRLKAYSSLPYQLTGPAGHGPVTRSDMKNSGRVDWPLGYLHIAFANTEGW